MREMSQTKKLVLIIGGSLLACILGLCGVGAIGALLEEDGGSTDQAADSTESSQSDREASAATSEAAPEPSETEDDPAADCTALKRGELRSIGEGLRKESARIVDGYIEEIGEDVGLGIEYVYAVRVTDGATQQKVVLGLGGRTPGDGLILATEPALMWFTWGAMTTEGSPADEARDAAMGSDAAEKAIACLG